MKAKLYDILLWEYIKNPWSKELWLNTIWERFFDYKMIELDKKNIFENLWIEIKINILWEQTYLINKIFNNQKEDNILKNTILLNIEIPLIEVLKNIELDWVYINPDTLKAIWLLLDKEIEILEKEIIEQSGEQFNIKSPKQVWYILFEKLAIPKWKKTKTWYSVSADVLWELAHEYKIAEYIVDYRHYTKLKSTYIEWLLKLIDKNNIIHTNYNTTVTSTWRLSSTQPNLQNIPSSNWIAGEIREAFVSRYKNWKIMTFDYSQVEIRLLAVLSNDTNLLKAFKEWHDIHHNTAEFIFPNTTITSSERKIAKAVNFWVIYWISGFWLSKMIWGKVADSNIYIKKFFKSYPQVKKYQEQIILDCKSNWYVETFFWRKRYIKWINDSNNFISKTAEREAINMPIQWTSADIIKIAMIKVNEYLTTNKLKSKMIMQVHDELVFDVFPWEEDFLKQNIIYIMENIIPDLKINLKVDIWIGASWKEAK